MFLFIFIYQHNDINTLLHGIFIIQCRTDTDASVLLTDFFLVDEFNLHISDSLRLSSCLPFLSGSHWVKFHKIHSSRKFLFKSSGQPDSSYIADTSKRQLFSVEIKVEIKSTKSISTALELFLKRNKTKKKIFESIHTLFSLEPWWHAMFETGFRL